jgi:hypothetical protein
MVGFQCPKCPYFEMLNEEQAAAVGVAFPEQAPLPFDFPPVPQALCPLQPFVPAKPVPKARCSISWCNRVAALECSLCKACCQGRGQGCRSMKHRSGPPTTRKPNTFAPSRPTTSAAFLSGASTTSPTLPSQLPASSSSTPELASTPNSSETQAPHSFREDMPHEWAIEWNAREKEASEKREAAELRKKNELAIARQVVIQLWRTV